MALSEKQVEVVYFIEQKFWETGRIPTNEVIAERFAVALNTVKGWWQTGTFREALVKRGVDFNPEQSSDLLTPIQLQLANVMLNTHDNRSEREKLNSLDVTSQQYHSWLRQPAFQNYLRKRAEAMFSAADFKAFQALSAEAAGGDVSALKLFFEMRGIYNPRVQIDVNVEAILMRVVEIIATHVKDPGTLEAIANDLERLQGRELPAAPVGTFDNALEVASTVSGFNL